MSKQTKELKKRIKEIEERIEAMIIAIPKEEASYNFYISLANSTIHEGAKRMFVELASLELEHKRKLEWFIEELQNELAQLKDQSLKKI